MILKTLTFQPDAIISMCAVCVSDRSGGRIALLIIVFSLMMRQQIKHLKYWSHIKTIVNYLL